MKRKSKETAFFQGIGVGMKRKVKEIIPMKEKTEPIISDEIDIRYDQFIINTKGFRKELDAYFPKYMFTMEKQISPFIVVQKNQIYKMESTNELFHLPNDITVLHAWPGKYRTDVFIFTTNQMHEWFDAQPLNYQEKYRRDCGIKL